MKLRLPKPPLGFLDLEWRLPTTAAPWLGLRRSAPSAMIPATKAPLCHPPPQNGRSPPSAPLLAIATSGESPAPPREQTARIPARRLRPVLRHSSPSSFSPHHIPHALASEEVSKNASFSAHRVFRHPESAGAVMTTTHSGAHSERADHAHGQLVFRGLSIEGEFRDVGSFS